MCSRLAAADTWQARLAQLTVDEEDPFTAIYDGGVAGFIEDASSAIVEVLLPPFAIEAHGPDRLRARVCDVCSVGGRCNRRSCRGGVRG